MWTDCMLEGDELDIAVSRIESPNYFHDYSTDWSVGGPLIERDRIFLDPSSGWNEGTRWSATVSARTRVFKDRHGRTHVGRGVGPTPLIAAMRAFVASHQADKS